MKSPKKSNPSVPRAASTLEFMGGGGEMGALIRATDWARTPLGPAERWPQSLRTALSIGLQSRYPIFIWWGPQMVNLYNDAYRPILGDKHPRSLGRPAFESWSEIWPIIGPMIDSVFRRGEATWAEDQLLPMQRHGYLEETYFTFSYSPIRDESGGVGGMFCACTETTERIIQERRLATLKDLSALAKRPNASEAGAHAVRALAGNPNDLPFTLVYLREGETLRLVGTTGLPEKSPLAPEILPGDARQPWPVADVLPAVGLVTVAEGEFGSARQAVVMPLPAAVGPAEGVFIAGVSPRRALDDAYRTFFQLVAGQLATAIGDARAFEAEKKRAEALAELDRAKTAFFSNVSHEFRTPLTLILGPLEEVLTQHRAALPEAAVPRLEVVARNSRRLLRLVNTMLEFSRIEAGRMRASYAPTDLALLTRDLASVFRSATERVGLALEVDCPDLPEPVYVDRDMWEKIVLNLVSNAFKFTFEGGISVQLRADAGRVVLTVGDTGIGIPEAALPRLFERFYRVENSRSRTQEGSGIGLALVQELVRMHGGSIRAQSRLGEGTKFSVEIPLGAAHLDPTAVVAPRAGEGGGTLSVAFVEEALSWVPAVGSATALVAGSGSRSPLPIEPDHDRAARGAAPRIVLADDNADMREYVARILAPHYVVEAVPDGAAALAAVEAGLPDLVLTDVMMPRVDGFELLRRLRADPKLKAVPVILLSARAGEEARVEGAAAGAEDYLVKPFSSRELLARVEAQVKLARLRRAANSELQARMAELERAHREAAVRTAQFETLLNQAPLGVYLVDADFRIREVNPMARPVFGDIPDLIGRDFAEVVHRLWTPDYADELVRLFRHTLETGEAYSTPERIEHRLDRGVTEYYAWRIDRIPLADGRFGVVCYFRDVSEQVLAETQLREARDEALAANRAKDVFLATLSHELRTPLNPVLLAASDAAANPELPEAVRADFGMIAENVQLQARLVDDLLDLSRLARGKLALDLVPLNVHEVARDAVANMREEFAAAELQVDFDLRSAAPVVQADPVRLRQVFWNVLKNAVKFTPPGGRVIVSSVDRGGGCEVRFRDTGIGLAAAELERMFQPFVQGTRLGDGLRALNGGLGLGLTISRMLVEAHGGHLSAESAGPGCGTTLVVALPRATAVPAPAAKPARPRSARKAREARPAAKRILFVEDNLPTQATLVRLLTRRGFNVTPAGSVGEALVLGDRDHYDVLISDLGLPDGDGCDVMAHLRRRDPQLAGIAISGFGMATDIARSRDAGFEEHLTKPVTFDALERALLRVVSPDGR